MTLYKELQHEDISALTGMIYDAAVDPRRWPDFLRVLPRAVRSEQALMLTVEKGATPSQELYTTGMDLDVINQWDGCKEHVDVWLQRVHVVPSNNSYLSTDLVSPEVLHRSGFHADILRPLGIEYSLGGVTENGSRRLGFFGIYRGAGAGSYTERDKYLYRLLVPQVHRALALSRQLALTRKREMAICKALDIAPFGVICVDSGGHALTVNAEANRILSCGDGISLRSDRVRLSIHEQQLALERMIAASIRTVAGEGVSIEAALRIHRPSGKRDYQLMVYPLPAEFSVIGQGDGGACLILMHDPEQSTRISPDLLCRLYGLTAAEARLCAALMECGSIDEVVERFGINRNTAKTQLAHVFTKVGVRSQAELLRDLALGLAHAGFFLRNSPDTS